MLKLNARRTKQPSASVDVDFAGNPYLSAVLLPNGKNWVKKTRGGSSVVAATSVTVNVSGTGILNNGAGNVISTNPDSLWSTSAGAILISFVRTSYTSSNTNWGPGIAGGVVSTYIPFSDNKVYWDFGNGTEGSGRLSVAGQTFSAGTVETWMFCAGSRGREIWRDGKLIGSNSGTATRASDTSSNVLDAAWSGSAQPLNAGINILAFFNGMPAQSACQALTSNPWQLTSPLRIWVPVTAAAGGTPPITRPNSIIIQAVTRAATY